MKKEMKYFAEFLLPGAFFGESTTKEFKQIPNPRCIEWPKNAYAVRIKQREDLVDGKKRYRGDTEQIGPVYYHPDSKVENLEQVKQNPCATNTLIRNMEINDWRHIVWSRWGNWPQPFDPQKDCVL